jgi:uncharacterized membrane protein YphA (DoxX/SURF4 family)
MWMAIASLASGLALLAGILTPVAALVTGLGAIGCAFSLLPGPAVSNLIDSRLAAVLIAIVATAIACLGPGAFSVDAYLFGRREIIIPRRSEE